MQDFPFNIGDVASVMNLRSDIAIRLVWMWTALFVMTTKGK